MWLPEAAPPPPPARPPRQRKAGRGRAGEGGRGSIVRTSAPAPPLPLTPGRDPRPEPGSSRWARQGRGLGERCLGGAAKTPPARAGRPRLEGDPGQWFGAPPRPVLGCSRGARFLRHAAPPRAGPPLAARPPSTPIYPLAALSSSETTDAPGRGTHSLADGHLGARPGRGIKEPGANIPAVSKVPALCLAPWTHRETRQSPVHRNPHSSEGRGVPSDRSPTNR